VGAYLQAGTAQPRHRRVLVPLIFTHLVYFKESPTLSAPLRHLRKFRKMPSSRSSPPATLDPSAAEQRPSLVHRYRAPPSRTQTLARHSRQDLRLSSLMNDLNSDSPTPGSDGPPVPAAEEPPRQPKLRSKGKLRTSLKIPEEGMPLAQPRPQGFSLPQSPIAFPKPPPRPFEQKSRSPLLSPVPNPFTDMPGPKAYASPKEPEKDQRCILIGLDFGTT
jgi:hypothetical protein